MTDDTFLTRNIGSILIKGDINTVSKEYVAEGSVKAGMIVMSGSAKGKCAPATDATTKILGVCLGRADTDLDTAVTDGETCRVALRGTGAHCWVWAKGGIAAIGVGEQLQATTTSGQVERWDTGNHATAATIMSIDEQASTSDLKLIKALI